MYDNILVINLMHIGDLLLTTPVLRALRSAYPESRLSLLADLKLRDLVEHNPCLDECLLIDKKGKDDSFWAIWRYARRLRDKRFDLVVNLHRNERASALAAFSGGRRIVGYSKPFFSWWFDEVCVNEKAVKHQVLSHFDVLTRACGVQAIDDRGLEMALPPRADDEAHQRWSMEFAADDRVVGFNIGGSWTTKRWLDGHFAKVADALIDEGYHVAFFGGPMDVALVKACTAQMARRDSARAHVFTGSVTLGVLAAMIRRCALFLTTDSGPMHVAVAMNVPVVAMFGASPVLGFSPYDAKDVALKSTVPCRPCDRHECRLSGAEYMKCMAAITPAAVLAEVRRLLAQCGGRVGTLARPTAFACQVVAVPAQDNALS